MLVLAEYIVNERNDVVVIKTSGLFKRKFLKKLVGRVNGNHGMKKNATFSIYMYAHLVSMVSKHLVRNLN